MFRSIFSLWLAIALVIGAAWSLQGQTATGSILGAITDASGAVVPNANVTVTSQATGIARTLTTNGQGLYSAPALQAGSYQVRVEVQGFRTAVRDAQVLAGTDTTVNVAMTLGESREVVTVEAAAAQMNYDSNTVAGSIERATIQDMPLNGRNFLELATLEPGVQIVEGATGARNAPIQISILGGATNQSFTYNNTLISLDGLSLMDLLDGGNTDLNFSQEMVQEFQISSLNYDIATGITSIGAVNIVSRSGGNDFHGSGFFFYRDHNMAAYPGLERSAIDPNPYFVRKDPGFYIGGPIKKDKVFFFFTYENIMQVQAVTFQPDLPSLQPLAANFFSPFHYHYVNGRFDWRMSDKHNAWLRYTHDGNAGFGPEVGQPSEPSAWIDLNNWSDQWAMGVTSLLRPNLVNDFRLGWRYWDNKENLPNAGTQCTPPCVDGNGPSIYMIGSSVFTAGVTANASQRRIARHYEPQDTLSWQKGSHRIRFGGDMDVYVDLWYYGLYAKTEATAYSPEFTRSYLSFFGGTAAQQQYFPNLPTSINSTAGLYNLPFAGGDSYLGELILPGPYHQNSERRDFRPKVFAQDTWKIRPNLTVNYGIAWQAETGDFNSDLPEPAYLAPILGANNLKPTPIDWRDFGPVVGFAWSPGNSNKTVIRGGMGEYWDSLPGYLRMENDGVIGPLGNGPISVTSTSFSNMFPGIVQLVNGQFQPVPVGAPLAGLFTNFTVGDWVQTFAQQSPAINAALTPKAPTNGPYTITALDISKSSYALYPPHVSITRSYQTSAGVQRDLGHDLFASVDWARRQSENTQNAIDLNDFPNFVNGVRKPVIPVCATSPDLNPNDECSTGADYFQWSQGRAVYEALLVKVQKRLSHRYQFTVSYAYQNLNSLGSILNFNNWFQDYGPTAPRQNLNISGVINLPFGFSLSLNSSMISRNPVQPGLTGTTLDGTGGLGGILPGPSYNCFAITCGKAELANAIASFNQTYSGKVTQNGAVIPQYVLPPNYQFGDPTFSQDFRLTKTFSIKERYKLLVFGEAFNTFNIANLTGYSFALDAYNATACGPLAAGASSTSCPAQTYVFGQPTQRAGQTFASSGPRAIQVGARFTF